MGDNKRIEMSKEVRAHYILMVGLAKLIEEGVDSRNDISELTVEYGIVRDEFWELVAKESGIHSNEVTYNFRTNTAYRRTSYGAESDLRMLLSSIRTMLSPTFKVTNGKFNLNDSYYRLLPHTLGMLHNHYCEDVDIIEIGETNKSIIQIKDAIADAERILAEYDEDNIMRSDTVEDLAGALKIILDSLDTD